MRCPAVLAELESIEGAAVHGDLHANLNANDIKSRPERHYPVLRKRSNGRMAHEVIFAVGN